MTRRATDDALAWDDLASRVDALSRAWQAAADPPELTALLPPNSAALRRVVLVELIKVDLGHRWRDGRWPKRVEDYATEFPELAVGGSLPCDLIYEEYHVRKQTGDTVEPRHFFERFPRQATELGRLLGLEAPHLTTTIVCGQRMQAPAVGESIDDFDLLTLLGKGAFASVFLARQRSMERLVAVKISGDRGVEPQTMAQLDHPNIVRVFDQRTLPERGLRLLYMQHVAGGTLRDVIQANAEQPAADLRGAAYIRAIDRALAQRGESPPAGSTIRGKLQWAAWPEVVCWVGARLAAALAYAHDRGVLHRDIKPANILVAADGNPKLADFNTSFSSKLAGATPAAYFGGSLAYMSPEQLEACDPAHPAEPGDLDGRSDVYSLGVVLWELLDGTRPFADDALSGDWANALATMAEARRAGVDRQTECRLSVIAPGLAAVVLKCLAPRAEDRYATAHELARDLELCLQPRAQKLLRSPGGWLRRLGRRFPVSTLAAAGILPNAVMSVLNIVHNLREIVGSLGPSDRQVFVQVLAGVNTIVYGLGVGLALAMVGPVVVAVRKLARDDGAAAETLATARGRCLRMGDYVAAIVGCLWLGTGFLFPAIMQTSSQSQVEPKHYALFVTSQVLTGLIAATQTFFLITLLAVRCYYPMLVAGHVAPTDEARQLAALARRTWAYFGLSVSVPFLAVILVVMLGAGQDVIAVLGGVGLVAFGLAFWMSLSIHGDLATLGLVVNPGGASLAGADTADSFWTDTR